MQLREFWEVAGLLLILLVRTTAKVLIILILVGMMLWGLSTIGHAFEEKLAKGIFMLATGICLCTLSVVVAIVIGSHQARREREMDK